MAEMTMEHRVRCGSHTSSGVVTLPDSTRGSLAPRGPRHGPSPTTLAATGRLNRPGVNVTFSRPRIWASEDRWSGERDADQRPRWRCAHQRVSTPPPRFGVLTSA